MVMIKENPPRHLGGYEQQAHGGGPFVPKKCSSTRSRLGGEGAMAGSVRMRLAPVRTWFEACRVQKAYGQLADERTLIP
jgi:hypothetical protein